MCGRRESASNLARDSYRFRRRGDLQRPAPGHPAVPRVQQRVGSVVERSVRVGWPGRLVFPPEAADSEAILPSPLTDPRQRLPHRHPPCAVTRSPQVARPRSHVRPRRLRRLAAWRPSVEEKLARITRSPPWPARCRPASFPPRTPASARPRLAGFQARFGHGTTVESPCASRPLPWGRARRMRP
jgi:hypothetical protein